MLHVQAPPQRDWDQALDRLPDGSLIKLVDTVQTAPEVKAHNETHNVLLRHVNNEGYVWSLDWQANVAQAEREFLTHIDGTFEQFAHLVDYVEEPRNEYYSQAMGEHETALRVMWAKACAYVWETVFRPRWPHIQCLIGNQGVGNDIPLGFFEAAYEHGAGIATHAYTHFNTAHTRDPQDHRYHSGRWNWQDEQARANGWEVPIAITEAGPYASTWDGWRSQYVLNGDINGYVEAMRGTIRDWMTTHAAQTDRLIGFALFTVYDIGWDLYQTGQPEANLLADMVAVEWQPGSDPPLPPPEPRTWSKLVYLLPQQTTREQYAAVADLAHESRTEIAFSADSAFARPGNVTAHRVVVYDVDAWGGQQALEDWVDEHYGYDPPTTIEYRDWPGTAAQTGVTFPVGTQQEREAATDSWPGEWTDANPYGNRYHVRNGRYAYHTGADLNLNEPHWDADRGQPIFAIADGTVTYAGDYNDGWGIIVVIDHGDFYSRYSAVAGLEVAVGDVVDAGQQIAVVDQHGEGEAYHLHFDISTTERLAENPGDWPGLTWSRLEEHYVDPLAFILERL